MMSGVSSTMRGKVNEYNKKTNVCQSLNDIFVKFVRIAKNGARPSQEPELGKARAVFTGNNEVIMQRDSQYPPALHKLTGQLYVLAARFGVSTRMIVGDNVSYQRNPYVFWHSVLYVQHSCNK